MWLSRTAGRYGFSDFILIRSETGSRKCIYLLRLSQKMLICQDQKRSNLRFCIINMALWRLSAAQRQVNNLGRGVDSQGEPVADAVGNDQLGGALLVEAGPVLVNASGAPVFGEHQLAAMGVPRQGEGDSRGGGGGEGLGMVGQEDPGLAAAPARQQG